MRAVMSTRYLVYDRCAGFCLDLTKPSREGRPGLLDPPDYQLHVQRDYAECILQLTLFPPGLAALHAERACVVPALRALATTGGGLSEAATDCARAALHVLAPPTATRVQPQPQRHGAAGERHAANWQQQQQQGVRDSVGGVAEEDGHVFLSYQWDHQGVILRLNGALQQVRVPMRAHVSVVYVGTSQSCMVSSAATRRGSTPRR